MWRGYKSVLVVVEGWLETGGFYLWNKYVSIYIEKWENNWILIASYGSSKQNLQP